MAIFEAGRGQTSAVPLMFQVTDANGAPATPTSPQVQIIDQAAAVVKATLVPTERLGLVGFMVATQSVADAVTWPAGIYLVRWTAFVTTNIVNVDYLQIHEAGQFALIAGGAGGSYTTEARIRNVAKPLEHASVYPTPLIAQKAADAAAEIDVRLRGMFAVPFAAPFDPWITILNDWLAASLLLEGRQTDESDENPHSTVLRARVEAAILGILSGTIDIGVATITEPDVSPTGAYSTIGKHDSDMFGSLKPIRSTYPR
jgi:phage gp36-like protein